MIQSPTLTFSCVVHGVANLMRLHCDNGQAGTEDGDEDEADVEMVEGGARTPLSPAVQRTVAAIIIRLASRAQYSKVCQAL